MPEHEEDSREARPEETPKAEPTMIEPHTESPPAPGPALSAEAVIPAFRRWWAAFSGDQLTHHRLRPRLDERVAAVGSVRVQACAALAQHIRERAPTGSPELLHGNPATLEGMTEDCWWLHHDGMLGPGLGAALSKDGHVLVVWIVPEG